MTYQRITFYYFRVTLDIVSIWFSFLFTEYMINGAITSSLGNYFLLFCLTMVWLMSAHASNLYDEFRSRNFSFELISLLKNIILQPLTCIIVAFIVNEINFSRMFPLLYSGFLVLIVGSQKYFLRELLNTLRLFKRNIRSVLIIGAGEVGRSFNKTIQDNPHFGYRVLGFLDDKRPADMNGEYVGPVKALDKILDDILVDTVIVALPNYAYEKVGEVVSICEKHTTHVKIIPDYFKFVSSKYSLSMFGQFPVISVRDDRLSDLHWRITKRTFDIVFSVTVIVLLLSWLIPLISLGIKLTSPGPVIFKQERWGRNNKKFIALKFRSMKFCGAQTDDIESFRQASKDDDRITPFGKFIRKTNLDELPQFFNVLLGDMSVVGPRPHPTPLNLQSKKNIRQYMLRHLVKPGITGWAQVHGFRGETKDPELMQKRVEYDLWYIENWSIWIDIQCIFLTVWRMAKGDPNAV